MRKCPLPGQFLVSPPDIAATITTGKVLMAPDERTSSSGKKMMYFLMGFDLPRKSKGNLWAVSMICLYIYTVYQSFPKITELERPQCSKHFDGGRALTVEAMLKPPTNGFPLTTH
jgi:hypothetical protein